jgi:predicted ATPase/DNA-binding SARP family transcriptional activator
MELHALGSVEVVRDGRPVDLGGPLHRRLLAVLVAHRGTVVSLDRLADAVWGDDPPATARATLQTHVSKLRRSISCADGAAIERRGDGYVLEAEPESVDVERFEAELDRAREALASDPGTALELVTAALGRWHGAAFAGFADDEAVRPEAVRLEELRLVAHELRADARLAVGDAATAVGELEALALEHPLRERLWARWMLALHHCGRQAEALRVAQDLRRRLADELGLEPSGDLRAVEQAIAADDPSVRGVATGATTPDRHAPVPQRQDRGGTGPDRSSPRESRPGTLTRLIGRDTELARATDAVMGSRLVTLTGPGGVGKSSLAVAATDQVADRFPDGVHLVELASLGDGDAVVAGVGQALEVQRRGERSLARSIVDVLGSRRALLVLDNCEHVIDAVADLVGEILRWCPEVHLLTTSREPLALPGEVVQRVAPLAVPPDPDAPPPRVAESPAVQLFTARAVEAASDFVVDDHNARAVAELCVALDGVPLALELAAARMASMDPGQLAERLHARWGVLGSGRAPDPRHRSLLALVEWSFELLDPAEQRLLADLSVFAGGFELAAVERTCGGLDGAPVDVASVVAALVDKSLVLTDRVDGRIRYRQLETLRQFGADRLARRPDAGSLHRAHQATYVDLAQRGGAELDGPDEGRWGDQLERDVGNLRVAARTAIEAGDADAALRIVVSCRELAFRRIRYEVIDWAERAVELEAARGHPLAPVGSAIVAYGAFVRGELRRAVEVAERTLADRRRSGAPSFALAERVLGNAHFYLGDHDVAVGWMDRMVQAARASGLPGPLAHALYMRSVAQTSVGDPERGAHLAAEATRAADDAGSPTAESQASYATGLAVAGRDPDAALGCFEHAAERAGRVANHWMRAFALTEAMWLRVRAGEPRSALAGYREVVETWYRGGDWANQWLSLRHVAALLGALGRVEESATLFGAVDHVGATTALPFAPVHARDVHRAAADVDRHLGAEARSIRRRGAAMGDDAVVAFALGAIDQELTRTT